MYAWETLTLYCAHNRRWFETSSRYLPDGTHLTVYRALMPAEWRLRRRGLWYIADPPDTPVALQGWKLHVTAPVDGTVEVLRRALPGLRDALVPFKFLLDPRTNAMTSRKTWPRGSSGKFLTVYPPSEERFLEIADWLAEALDGIAGPYILSDRRYRGSKAVYYRYGGFVGLPQLQPDGTAMLMIKAPDGSLVPDLRQPYWHAPEWAGNPVADDGDEGSDDDQLLGGRFAVTAALSFSNQGGVYVASDARTGRDVAIKEARPHVLCGSANAQAVDVLEKEHRLLQLLADTGRFVRPVAFFREWEHAFLAEERLDGQQLGQLSISLNPLCNLDLTGPAFHDYLTRMRDLWRQVAEAIAAAHERGVLLGDLSFTNVMVVDGDRTVKVIDLEAAVQEGIDPELGIHTIGFASPRTVETNRYDRANDYHALGALMLGSLMVVNSTVGYYRPALRRFLDALAADLALPPALVVLIADLTDEEARDWDPNEVLARIDALDFSAAEPPPLAPLTSRRESGRPSPVSRSTLSKPRTRTATIASSPPTSACLRQIHCRWPLAHSESCARFTASQARRRRGSLPGLCATMGTAPPFPRASTSGRQASRGHSRNSVRSRSPGRSSPVPLSIRCFGSPTTCSTAARATDWPSCGSGS